MLLQARCSLQAPLNLATPPAPAIPQANSLFVKAMENQSLSRRKDLFSNSPADARFI